MNNVDFSTRREFLKTSASAGGGLVLTLNFPTSSALEEGHLEEIQYSIHSLVEIDKSGKILIGVAKHEMGQGVDTGMPQIIADEMDANWNDVEVRLLDYDENARQLDLGEYPFGTGGSSSIERNWQRFRTIGAVARELMKKAAANYWQVEIERCFTSESFVHQKNSDLKLSYAELAESAAKLDYSPNATLKNKEEYTLMGKSRNRIDAPLQVTGQYVYSIDEKIPGMVYATIERAPVKGGKIISIDRSKALNIPGVIDVIQLDASPSYDMWMTGAKNSVAVLAKSNWSAMQGRKALQIKWNDGPNASRNSSDVKREFFDKNKVTATTRSELGPFEENLKQAHQVLKAEYSTPYLSHALMEPLHATARINPDNTVEVWTSVQAPKGTAEHISKELKLDPSQITVHTRPSGGSFGRRAMTDYVIEAVLLAKKSGKTVSLLWTREDEIQHGRYHPQRLDIFEIGLSKKGEIVAFGFDGYTTHPWGAFAIVPTHAKSRRIRSHVLNDFLVDYGSWRAVGRHLHYFSTECVIDELAHKLRKDPVAYRLELLDWPVDEAQKGAARARLPLKKVIMIAAEMARWGRKLKKGVGLGIGAVKYRNTFCVQIAEVEATENKFKVKRIWCAIDCGLAINPNLIEAQVEGSIIWALSPVLHGGIDVVNGRVVQSNFHDQKKIRINEIPEIEIKIIESDRDPCGVGEPAVPPLAPAVLNAYFAATGIRTRSLPLFQ